MQNLYSRWFMMFFRSKFELVAISIEIDHDMMKAHFIFVDMLNKFNLA